MKKSLDSKPFFIEIICALLFLVIASGVLFSLYSQTLKSTITANEKNAAIIQMKSEAEKISHSENPDEMKKLLGERIDNDMYLIPYDKNFEVFYKNPTYKMVTTCKVTDPQFQTLYDVKIDFYKVLKNKNEKICGIETKKFFTEKKLYE